MKFGGELVAEHVPDAWYLQCESSWVGQNLFLSLPKLWVSLGVPFCRAPGINSADVRWR